MGERANGWACNLDVMPREVRPPWDRLVGDAYMHCPGVNRVRARDPLPACPDGLTRTSQRVNKIPLASLLACMLGGPHTCPAPEPRFWQRKPFILVGKKKGIEEEEDKLR